MIKLFISRIPYSLTSHMLIDLFSPFGQVNSAKISTNALSSESLGCGYVEMTDVFDGQTAILKLNGLIIEGRRIAVSRATLQKEKICT